MLGLSTGSLHNYGIDRVFALASRSGFDGVEVIVDQRWDTRQTRYLQLVRDRHSLPILSLHAPFLYGIQGWDNDPLLGLRRTVDLARTLDVHVVIFHLPMRWHWLSLESSLLRRRVRLPIFLSRSAASRRTLLQTATALSDDGVTVLLENMPAARWLGLRYGQYHPNRPEDLAEFDALVLDTSHVGTWGWELLEVYERLRSRIRHVHFSDYNGWEHIAPGKGGLPLAQLLRRLGRDGFAGAVVVESGPEHLAAHNEDLAERALVDCVAFCRAHLAFGVVV